MDHLALEDLVQRVVERGGTALVELEQLGAWRWYYRGCGRQEDGLLIRIVDSVARDYPEFLPVEIPDAFRAILAAEVDGA